MNIKNCIFFVRHGECLGNAGYPYEDYDDNLDVLTELGIKQINLLVDYFLNFDTQYTIISSTLKRAVQSSEILNKKIKKSILLSPDFRLNEIEKNDDIKSFLKCFDLFMKERTNNVKFPLIIVTHGHIIEEIIKNYSNNKKEIYTQIANGSLSVMLNKKFICINQVLYSS